MVALATSSGVTSLHSLTGALTIAGTANEVTVTPSGSTIILATPQAIATSSSPTFANVTTPGVFQSSVTGLSTGFQISNNNAFLVNGNGTVSIGSTGGINLNGSTPLDIINASLEFQPTTNNTWSLGDSTHYFASGYFNAMNVSGTGTTSINTAGGISAATQLAVNGHEIANSVGAVIAATGFYVNNGTTYTGQTQNVVFPSFTINGTTYHTMVFVGGIWVGYL
jgi:hypothetical protein